MNLGIRIKALRKRRNLTRNELGELLGVHFPSSTISRYEMNKTKPQDKYMNRLIKILNVDEAFLLSDTDDATINLFIDLFWQMKDGEDIILLDRMFECFKEYDEERYRKFVKIIKLLYLDRFDE
ncbi:MAG: helix-turn-helix domain-containing protein [Erysipelotrichaceae bacterium]|nr:helix-turn-helix domain-containing protein [Erysipelotrichaceae bacterium]